MSRRSNGARYWVFTINNYTESDVQWVKDTAIQALRMVASKEVGEGKTRHIQGEIGFRGAKRLSALKKLHARAHWETMRSQDFGYPIKDDSEVIVNVDNRRQGKRTDLDSFQEACREHAAGDITYNKMFDEHFGIFMKYRAGAAAAIEHYRERGRPNPSRYELIDFKGHMDFGAPEELKSIVLEGPTGYGKTQFALAHFDHPLLVSHMDDLARYNQDHDGIVFDDMDFKHLPRSTQIYLVDVDQPRSIHIRYKTAYIPAGVKKVFTCNEYPFESDPAIDRRVVRKYCQNKLFC